MSWVQKQWTFTHFLHAARIWQVDLEQENGTEQINSLVDELNEKGLPAMATSLDSIYHSGHFLKLYHLTLLSEIVGVEYQVHMSNKWNNRLKRACLSGCPAQMDKCSDSKERAYLPHDITGFLVSLDFIRDGMSVCILGPSDNGKTYLAKAIGIAACQEFRVAYLHWDLFWRKWFP